ncbi:MULTISPECIES: Sec-independent protein translocase subunit TatA [unclassified Frankia]|uniref:Sec-independent protein translocase subunit TatA n=1 Tax=unclassified Frankia TaxID=2632575 RepID=UPI002AD371C9|nr:MULTISPECIES: Sec-independent protein translocase subunit TatA [unclassified Frankia]
MGALSPWHLLIVAVVFVVLFGSRKLPDSARSIGRSLRIFKSEIRALNDDDTTTAQAATPAAVTGNGSPAALASADSATLAAVRGGPQAG